MLRYAAANVPVYWMVNLVDGQVEVYTEPVGGRYTHVEVYPRGQEVSVVIGGQTVGRIAVSDIPP
jgi:hypothetical protein